MSFHIQLSRSRLISLKSLKLISPLYFHNELNFSTKCSSQTSWVKKRNFATIKSQAEEISTEELESNLKSLTSNSENRYFVDVENTHLRNIIFKKPEYAPTLFSEEKFKLEEKKKSFNPIVQEWLTLSSSPTFSFGDLTVTEKVQALVTSNLTEDEVLAILFSFSNIFHPRNNQNFRDLLRFIDSNLLLNVSTNSRDKNFIIADLFFLTKISKVSNFHWNLIKKLFRRVDKLSKEHFIRFLFLLNNTRELPDYISTYEIEYQLSKYINEIPPDEIPIVALGFFKTETLLRDTTLFANLLLNFSKDPKSHHSIDVAAVAKLARHSSNYLKWESVYKFLESFYPEIDRLSILACVHLALVGSRSGIIHKELILKVLTKVEKELDQCRLKDIERIFMILTTFNMEEADGFFEKVLREIGSGSGKRNSEALSFGRSLTSIVYYASMRGIFHFELIEKVLDPEFIATYYKNRSNLELLRELVCLDFSLEIECPEYKGQRLKHKYMDYIIKLPNYILSLQFKRTTFHTKGNKPSVSKYEQMVKMVKAQIEEVIGDKNIPFMTNILPHVYSAQIIMTFDKNGNPQRVPNSLEEIEVDKLKRPPKDDGLEYHAFVVSTQSAFTINTLQPKGGILVELKQCQKLGYKTHHIPFHELMALDSNEKRKNYIEFYIDKIKNQRISSQLN